MPHLLLNTIALEPNRWTADKIPYFKLEDLLPPIADAGFHFLEIWQHHLTTRSRDEIITLKSQMEDLGISTRIIGLYPPMHLDGQDRQREMATVQKAIEYATTLGAHTIKVFVGLKASAVLSPPAYKRSVTFAQEMTHHMHQFGLTLTGETHANTLFDSRAACFRFLEDVGAANFKVCFQPYDFTNTDQALKDYAVFADQVTHVHLQGRQNNEMSLLTDADIDYRQLFEKLAGEGFDGDICIEFLKDCVVDRPQDFDVRLVLGHAQTDREYIIAQFTKYAVETRR